jgi:hypothetical protein
MTRLRRSLKSKKAVTKVNNHMSGKKKVIKEFVERRRRKKFVDSLHYCV